MKKGIKDNPKLMRAESMDEIGKINVGMFIDFNTSAFPMTEYRT
jgi:hypothetical protein